MSKNIVICLDGTGNEFGDKNSNVVKLCQILHRDPARQIVYYNPGVGTHPEVYQPTIWGKMKHCADNKWGQITGKGILKNVECAYIFLMNNYKIGDQVYIFGFSRGAYIARVLCSLIYKFGVLDRGNDNLVKYALTLLVNKNKKNDLLAEEFSKTFGVECPVHFLGIWDTVSSVYWLVDPPYIQHTKQNPEIKKIRHAISIDERRAYFRANMFAPAVGQDCQEVWFSGVHADIGGGYQETESGLSKVTLEWMLKEAELADILVDEDDKRRVMGGESGGNFVKPNPEASMHNEECSASNLFGFAELIPKRIWNTKEKEYVWKLPRLKRRIILDGSYVHRSVEARKTNEKLNYNPPNLPPKEKIHWVE